MTAECDGISFLPTLLGNNEQQRQHPYMFWYASEKGGKRSVLQWPWKLLHLNTGSSESSDESENSAAKKKPAAVKPLVVQLFNLESDPTESKNVAAENPELLKKLEAIMKQAWRDPS